MIQIPLETGFTDNQKITASLIFVSSLFPNHETAIRSLTLLIETRYSHLSHDKEVIGLVEALGESYICIF